MFYHKHHHRFHCSYLKGWEKRTKSQRFIHQAEESHWCPDHISLPTACPSHITRRRGHPQGRLLRKPTEHMQTYRVSCTAYQKQNTHTLKTFTAATSKITELLGATKYIILAYSSYIIFWSQRVICKKKKKKWPVSAHAKVATIKLRCCGWLRSGC